MVGETWHVSPNDCTTSLGRMQQSRKQQKQKAFRVSEKQNPPTEGLLLVCLDFADIVIDVIDGMTPTLFWLIPDARLLPSGGK